MMITIDDLKKIEIRIGTVLAAESIPDTDKLMKLSVDVGEDVPRQIISGIKMYVQPEDLIQQQYCFITNLEPRTIKGLESNGMILATGEGDTFSLVSPTKRVSPGSLLR